MRNQMKRSLGKRVQRCSLTASRKFLDGQLQNWVVGVLRPLTRSLSCPSLAVSPTPTELWTNRLPRSFSVTGRADHQHLLYNNRATVQFQQRMFSTLQKSASERTVRGSDMQGLQAVCACPSPCPNNCCLPPPCNTPPKCIKYMTGYYYYPYGTWFCGPYHVATGPCGPCTGPVTPSGPCGPSNPCAPPGCGPCGPLSCCGVCGMTPNMHYSSYMPNSHSVNAQYSVPFNMQSVYDPFAANYNQYSYNPYSTFSTYPSGCMPWTQSDVSSMPGFNVPGQNMPGSDMPCPTMPNPYFGPGINVPITPTPVTTEPCGPITPTTNPGISRTPKSSVRINPDYLKESHLTAPIAANTLYGPTPPIPTKAPRGFHQGKAYTGTRQISTARNSCSSNLTPKPLRQSPPSRYDAICALSRNNPFTRPRITQRTLSKLDTVQISYYSTRRTKKMAQNEASFLDTKEGKSQKELGKKNRQDKVSDVKKTVDQIDSKPLCYWCMLDKKSCSCQHGLHCHGFAHKKLPTSDIRSKSSEHPQHEKRSSS